MNFDFSNGAGGTYYIAGSGGTGGKVFPELVPIGSKTGYIVGLKGGVLVRADSTNPNQLRAALERLSSKTGYSGYWVDGNLVYIDPVKIVVDVVDAVRHGFENSQKEIFDAYVGKSFPIELVDETQLYSNILRRFSFGNHDIFCCWSFDHLGRETFVCGVDISDDESVRSFNEQFNPPTLIDRAVIQIVNFSQSQSRRENNVNGCDV